MKGLENVMELLIDTNVILDMVLKRDKYEVAVELFRRIKQYGAKALITASSVTDLFYIIRKETHDTSKTYQIMDNILKLVEILSVTGLDVRKAFEKGWKNFEDCVQYTIAQNNEISYVVTSNKKDFEMESVPVLSPDECLERLQEDAGNQTENAVHLPNHTHTG